MFMFNIFNPPHLLCSFASFVHTWMPEPANKLMLENMSKNLIDQDEYPATRKHPFADQR